jgi:hypothetical protein
MFTVTSSGSGRPRLIATPLSVALVLSLLNGCALFGRVAVEVLIEIATTVIVKAGEEFVQEVQDADEPQTAPVLRITHTDAAGVLVGTAYQIDQVKAISVNAVSGEVVISGDGRVRSVTVAPGSSATIEIVPEEGDRPTEVVVAQSAAGRGGPAPAVTPTGPPAGAGNNQPVPPPRQSKVTLAPLESTFALGRPATIKFSGMPGGSGDWIGIARPGAADKAHLEYLYTGGATSGVVTFSDLEPGRYEARAYFDNSYVRQASAAFSVGGSRATVTVSAKRYAAGSPVAVRFAGMPGNSMDWIGISVPGSDERSYVTYQNTDGAVAGTLTFTDLPAGKYEARAYFKGGYLRLATSSQFEVE